MQKKLYEMKCIGFTKKGGVIEIKLKSHIDDANDELLLHMNPGWDYDVCISKSENQMPDFGTENEQED